ncbi:MAG: glycosyltransferase family 39 protein [Myxococcota bacterium]|nr:glycosyltransferase family 39 protein [Myxococcota bacterium]
MMSRLASASAAARDRWVLGAVLAAVFLRAGLVALFPDPVPVNDEIDYWRLAEALARGEGFASNFRPPLHPAFMAVFIGMGGDAVAVRLAQAVLGALSVVLVGLVAERVGGLRAARAAAWFVALDPVLVGFSHLLWSETLYIALLLLGLFLLLRGAGSWKGWDWAGAGLALGLASLARPQLLTFLPWLLPWAWLQARRAGVVPRRLLVSFGLLTLATCCVVLPWSLRNFQVSGDWFLVDTNGPYNLLVSTEPGAHRVDKDDRWSPRWAAIGNLHYMVASERAPGRVQRLALERAVQRIRANPARYLEKSLWEAGHLFTLDNFVLRHLRNDWYGVGSPPGLTAGLTLLCVLWTMALYAGGGVGLLAAPASPFRGFALLAIVHAVLLFGVTYSLSRYAVPLRPLFAIALAWALTHPVAVRERVLGNRWVAALALLVVAVLLGVWVRDLPLLADLWETGGKGFLFVRSATP